MAAPTNAALVKKTLANSEPSTHGPKRHPLASQHSVAIGGIADDFPVQGERLLNNCYLSQWLTLRKVLKKMQ